MSEPPHAYDMILTPGGWRRRKDVHVVRPGEVVRSREDGRTVVTLAEQSGPPNTPRRHTMSTNLVLTPGGYRHPSLVHRVDPGFVVHLIDSRPRLMRLATQEMIDVPPPVSTPGAVPGFGSGWIA